MLELTLTSADIDGLIDDLRSLQQHPDQHFHLTHHEKNYIDVEVSMQADDEESDSSKSSFVIEPKN